jgi:hypothetical protein
MRRRGVAGIRDLGEQHAGIRHVPPGAKRRAPEYLPELCALGEFEAQQGWKEMPEFRERIMRVRTHCEDFQPAVYELVTTVE